MADPAAPKQNPAWRFSRPHWSLRRHERRGPKYSLPLSIMARAIWCVIRGRRRDVWRDAQELSAGMRPQPVVRGIENVPCEGACVLLPNHYERPDGVWVGWGAIAMSAALAGHRPPGSKIRWVMTSSWEDCYVGPRRIAPEHVHWVLRKLAGLYGIILMSPLPGETQARGHALREIFKALEDTAGNIVALHPEAGGFEELIEPPRGMGRVLAAIDRKDLPMIPVAVFEEQGQLHIVFGTRLPGGSLAELPDEEAAAKVMLTLASMVPGPMRGPYARAGEEQPTAGAALVAE